MAGDKLFTVRVSGEWLTKVQDVAKLAGQRGLGPHVNGDITVSDLVFLSLDACFEVAPPLRSSGLGAREKFGYSPGHASGAASGLAGKVCRARRAARTERERRQLLKNSLSVIEGSRAAS